MKENKKYQSISERHRPLQGNLCTSMGKMNESQPNNISLSVYMMVSEEKPRKAVLE